MKLQSVINAAALFVAMANAQAKPRIGCYTSSAGMKLATLEDPNFNSWGACSKACGGSMAFAMSGKKCYCGDEIPADSDKVANSACTSECPGYPQDNCGGLSGKVMVYDAGISDDIPKAKSGKTATSSSAGTESTAGSSTTASSTLSQITVAGETVVVTAPGGSTPTSDTSSESSSSKPNVAGIAAGVVVGVVAIAGILGGLFLFMRNRKRKAIEEEHRRNAAVSSFIGGGKPTSSAGASSFTDTRLDPVMAQRRMSDGSIADNQDYSRRILKVTNA